jgi:hypothetical protein
LIGILCSKKNILLVFCDFDFATMGNTHHHHHHHHEESHDEPEQSMRQKVSSVRGIFALLFIVCGLAGAGLLFYTYSEQDTLYTPTLNGSYLTFLVSAMALAPIINTLAFIMRDHRIAVVSGGLVTSLGPLYCSNANLFRRYVQGDHIGAFSGDIDYDIGLAGMVLLLTAAYGSFLSLPSKMNAISVKTLVPALFIGLLNVVAAILFFVSANDVNDPQLLAFQSRYIETGVLNLHMTFFFLASVFLASQPLSMAALFYAGFFYVQPLGPALNSTLRDQLVDIDDDTIDAASALSYAGICLVIIFYTVVYLVRAPAKRQAYDSLE